MFVLMVIIGERIPFNDVKCNIVKSSEPVNSIADSINNAEIILCQILNGVNNSSALIPYASSIGHAIRKPIIDHYSELNVNLQDIVQKEMTKRELGLFNSWVEDTESTINLISSNDDEIAQIVIIHLHSIIRSQAGLFDNISLRQKYAITWVNPILSLYAFALVYEGIIEERKSHFIPDIQLSCRVKDVLTKYRDLIVTQRLKAVQVSKNSIRANTFFKHFLSFTSVQTQRDLLAEIVINLPYNEMGYMEHKTSINCKNIHRRPDLTDNAHKYIDDNIGK